MMEQPFRSEQAAEPLALQPGDWLLNGRRVLAVADSTSNGQVEVYLTGDPDVISVRIPAGIPVALGVAPKRLNMNCGQGHKPFSSSGFCGRCGAEVPVERPAMPDWAPVDGPWCLKQWLPFNIPDPKIDTCLLELYHEGDCRGIHGIWYNNQNGRCIHQLSNKES